MIQGTALPCPAFPPGRVQPLTPEQQGNTIGGRTHSVVPPDIHTRRQPPPGGFTRVVLFVVLVSGCAGGWSWFTGYSGSPGSWGTCARSCHGSSGGTLRVEGFPSEYVPGHTYEIRVGHDDGHAISNFNAAVCKGIGQLQAGVITAGHNSETYSHPHEPNGVHLVSVNLDSCLFYWTAPDSDVGEVRMYLAGCQVDPGRPNTDYILPSQPSSGIQDKPAAPCEPVRLDLSPQVVADRLRFEIGSQAGRPCVIRVLDAAGRVRNRVVLPRGGEVEFTWTPRDASGRRLPPGTYFAEMRVDRERPVRRFDIPR